MLNVSAAMVKAVFDGTYHGVAAKREEKRQKRLLDQEHIEFLTSDETLKRWREYSLLQRTVLFQEEFPTKLISKVRLRKEYAKSRIKHRVIRVNMLLNDS